MTLPRQGREVHRCAMSKRLRVQLRERGVELIRARVLLRKLLNHLKGCGRQDLHADMLREIEGVVGSDPPRDGLH